MQTYPHDIRDKLEFSKVIAAVQQECLSEMAVASFDGVAFSSRLHEVERWLDETNEWKKAYERGDQIPLSAFFSISDDIYLLRKEGYVLEAESIRNIYLIVSIGLEVSRYFQDAEKARHMPLLQEIVSAIRIDRQLLQEIDRVLDEEGHVRPTASEELMRLTKQIRSREREIDRLFNQELEHYSQKGYLVETQESVRDGRRVLTVAVEHKRKVPGILHDESSTGKTVYIEPEKVVPLHQDMLNLYAERRHEIYRILRALCAYLRPYADTFLALQHILVKLDTVRAKARFAIRLGATRPNLQQEPLFCFKQAFNPLLLLRHESDGRPVIPFDLELYHSNRIFVLSGPNAGGKSVALKTVGLLQMMVQSGLLVTADENSTFGMFEQIFVDIGDQQSLEDDLSTYSSHLVHMKKMTSDANGTSMVLIDEFGAGTDPKIGGSIAEGVLYHLNQQHVFAVITTHYSNLKYFASKTPGIVNGSMEFDRQHLSPTFRLHVGKPGSSFAFEIAEKIGLDPSIIAYAHTKTGKNEKAIDDLLASLMEEKKEYEAKLEKLLEKQDKLDRLISTYEQMQADLEIRKKKLVLKAREQDAYAVSDQQRELQEVLKEIRHKRDEEKAMEAAIALRKKQEEAAREVERLKMEVFASEISAAREPLRIGSQVRMRNGDSTGEIVALDKGVADVQMGFLTVKVPLIDLVLVKDSVQSQQVRTVKTTFAEHHRPDTKIDIREYTKSDALHMLQQFMDRALLNNLHEVRIIHGVGTGVMRKEVRKLLKQYKDVRDVWHPEPEQGGEGVTMVRL